MINKDLLQSTGDNIQCLTVTYSGKEHGRVLMIANHRAERLKPTRHYRATTLQRKNETFNLSGFANIPLLQPPLSPCFHPEPLPSKVPPSAPPPPRSGSYAPLPVTGRNAFCHTPTSHIRVANKSAVKQDVSLLCAWSSHALFFCFCSSHTDG